MPTKPGRSRSKQRLVLIHDNLDATLYQIGRHGGSPKIISKGPIKEGWILVRVLPRLGFKLEVFDLSQNITKAVQPVDSKVDALLDKLSKT